MKTLLQQIRKEGLLQSIWIFLYWRLWMPHVQKRHKSRCHTREAWLRKHPEEAWKPLNEQLDWYSPHFYLDKTGQDQVARHLQTTQEAAVQACLETCEAILEGDFSWLIEGWNSRDDVPDWFQLLDRPGSWPHVPAGKIDYYSDERPADIRRIWELNRHQYFMVLGRGWRLTKDPRIAECFVRHLESWLDENPFGMGPNWTQAQEVALRSISWCWAWHLFHDAAAFNPELKQRFLKSLAEHLRYLESDICAFGRYTHNHLISELAGLHLTARFFPFLPEAAKLERWTRKLLLRETEKQIYPDGLAGELASNYMLFVLDSLIGVLASDAAAWQGSTTEERVLKMAQASASLIRPDGSLPFFGDNDSGRGWILSEDMTRRETYAWLPAMHKGLPLAPQLKGPAPADMLWLFGLPTKEPSFEGLQHEKLFRDGGIWTWRSSTERDAHWVLLRGGATKRRKAVLQSHHHADALSFELAWRGRPVIVDPGTFAYSVDNALRQHFRSARAHSTLHVEGYEMCSFRGKRFGVWDLPDSVLQDYGSSDSQAWIQMQVSYKGVSHSRRIETGMEGLLVHDMVRRPLETRASLGLQLAPGIEAIPEANGWLLPEPGLRITIEHMQPDKPDLSEEQAFVSHRYAQREEATMLRIHLPQAAEVKSVIRIQPVSGQ